MSGFRALPSNFWDIIYAQHITLEETALYVFLCTHRSCNQIGAFQITKAQIADQFHVDISIIESILESLERPHLIELHENSWVFIPLCWYFQPSKSWKNYQGAYSIVKTLPPPLMTAFYQEYSDFLELRQAAFDSAGVECPPLKKGLRCTETDTDTTFEDDPPKTSRYSSLSFDSLNPHTSDYRKSHPRKPK